MSTLPDLPTELAGWAWRRTTAGGAILEAPDGWKTKEYTRNVSKAVDEAKRRVLSQPKPTLPTLPEIPPDLAGWEWERSSAGTVRLTLPAEGYVTRFYPPTAEAAETFVDARLRLGADAAAGELEDLIAEYEVVDARVTAGIADIDDRRALERIADRADVLGAIGLGTQAAGLLEALGGPGVRARAEQVLAQAKAAIAQASPASLPAPATAWQPGPDLDGVYRRRPGMAERLLVAPCDLVDGRWQPREAYNQEALDELTESIREHGVLEDLIALVNEYGELELITGHRRKRAAQAAGGRDVPVKIVEVTLGQATEIAIISNDQRSDLTDLERGKAYEKMIAELGISEAKLAERLSRPRAYIQQRRMIAGACLELQAAVASGELGFTQARAICLGSGGDHKTQAAVTVFALGEIRADRPETATRLQVRAEQTVRERHMKDLAKLGWKYQKFYRSYGGDLHLFYARTAKPATWSSGEILAAVKEARRPPDGAEPAQLTAADRQALEVAGWRIFIEHYCAPWTIIERSKETAWGDAGDLAEHIVAAHTALATLTARYEAKGWQVQAVAGRGYLKLTPPTPEPEPGSKKKPKKPAPVDARLADAEKLITAVEAGTWKPEAAKSSSSSSQSYTCKRCGAKGGWQDMDYIDGNYHCKSCAALIQAEHAALKVKLGAVVDRDLGAWLDAAPALAATLLRLKNSDPAGAELRGVLTDWLWNYRDRFKLIDPPAETDPATAVAPAPAETLARAEALTFAQVVANLDGIEERWATGEAYADDPALLDQLVDALEELAGDETIPTAVYEEVQRRIGELLVRLDEEGVPQ